MAQLSYEALEARRQYDREYRRKWRQRAIRQGSFSKNLPLQTAR